MAIWNLGSINVDIVYSVPHIPAPGETLATSGRATFLGGKGANMSVAAARAGAHCAHVGAVGESGRWCIDRLTEYGVDTRHIAMVEADMAEALIMVDTGGENAILLHPGANHAIPADLLRAALAEAETGDWFVCQNETLLQPEACELARRMGLTVAYAAAPFVAEAVTALIDDLDLLILNEVEARQLAQATGQHPSDLAVAHVIVTKGGDGVEWFDNGQGTSHTYPAVQVDPVDTTGAGDTFTGYLLAGLDRGMEMEEAIGLASHAGALMVTRRGTSDVIPDLSEVLEFRESRQS